MFVESSDICKHFDKYKPRNVEYGVTDRETRYFENESIFVRGKNKQKIKVTFYSPINFCR